MNIRHLPAQVRVARPWRNSGGITRDIAVFPDGSDDNTFLWRASIATVTDVGQFSTWHGVDRTLLVLRGQLVLAVEGIGERRLDENSPTIAFSGEQPVSADPQGGPCRVLNLMVRRHRAWIRLERCAANFSVTAFRTLVIATQSTMVGVNGLSFQLDEDDALMLGPDHSQILEIERSAIVVEFDNSNNAVNRASQASKATRFSGSYI
jgi:environmental stress-induced protein Ves